MEEFSPELLRAFTRILNRAAQLSTVSDSGDNTDDIVPSQRRPPPFTISQYSSVERTTIKDYFTRFSWALELSKIPVNQHANYARVYMGSELNDTLKFLVSPVNPETLSYDEIKTTLSNHLDSTRNKYAESIKFRQVKQNEGESVASFSLRLRQTAAHCEYESFLDRMLIEQLLHGLLSRESCDEIIEKKPSKFSEAYEIAHSLEVTRNTANEVKTPNAEITNKIGFEKPKSRRNNLEPSTSHRSSQNTNQGFQMNQPKCTGCGGSHTRSQCTFWDAECIKCRKKGHISTVCRSGSRNPQRTNQIVEDEFPAEQIDVIQHLDEMISSVSAFKKIIARS
ncbi:uncharacterized protein LOC116173456 [Photinus pyralis]|uniref:uncharacterized protein LOC116173456 n=1 Tax=Photinus pyralis TaxID=7054 RepID=UPI001267600D|nr:uncharacterized protein LOC116173456 [Photinus pyralis]